MKVISALFARSPKKFIVSYDGTDDHWNHENQ